VFRLIGFLVIFALSAGGFMFVDYKMSARWSGREDAGGLTFGEYLQGLSGRISGMGGGGAHGMPKKLADMLPNPPEGWKARPVEAGDIDGFLPKSSKNADKKGVAAVKAMAEGAAGSGVEVAALTFQKGDRKVIVKAIRYPNIIFTSFAAMQQRLELRMKTAEFRGTEFATVRGLDVTEDLLPDGFRGRYFLADVGAQIHLRILAPKRMTDEELVPFLETLHVKAMNASVVDKVEGLGEVPVIVLASALDGVERDAYLADVAARSASEATRAETERAEAEAAQAEEVPTEEGSGGGFLSSLFGGDDDAGPAEEAKAPANAAKPGCKTGKDGVKRCTVESAVPAEN
jgi:hypothetical protein